MGKAVEPSQWFSLIASFALVLVLLLATLWVLRKIGAAGLRSNSGRRLSIVDSLWLGNRQRVVLLRVDGREILLGVSAQGISRLDATSEQAGGASNTQASVEPSRQAGAETASGSISGADVTAPLPSAPVGARKRFMDAMRSSASRVSGEKQ